MKVPVEIPLFCAAMTRTEQAIAAIIIDALLFNAGCASVASKAPQRWQVGVKGDTEAAYREYLRQFIETVNMVIPRNRLGFPDQLILPLHGPGYLSFVMKGETLPAGTSWQGIPALPEEPLRVGLNGQFGTGDCRQELARAAYVSYLQLDTLLAEVQTKSKLAA